MGKGSAEAIAALTGFVKNLYDMIQGGDNDAIEWLPNGEAFRVLDVERLESETLPKFFRHSKFQSLVRQLNFYSFRKVNRERSFSVYYHPNFHRDRPEDMVKLKRRTCSAYDARKTNQALPSVSYVDGMVIFSEDQLGRNSRSPSPTERSKQTPGSHFHRVVSDDAGMNERGVSPISSEGYCSSDDSTAVSAPVKRCYYRRKRNENAEESALGGQPIGEIAQDQDHLSVVAEVKRDLQYVCANHDESKITSKQTRKKARDRCSNLPWFRERYGLNGARSVFGLEKPQDHYFGQGKFDLVTYEYEEGDYLYGTTLQSETGQATLVTPSRTDERCTELNSPSKSEISAIVEAIEKGGVVGPDHNAATRSLLSSLLEFCLDTSPNDPVLDRKVSSHLALNSFLAREFEQYVNALSGDSESREMIPEELRRDFRMFAGNMMQSMESDCSSLITPSLNGTIKQCAAAWSRI